MTSPNQISPVQIDSLLPLLHVQSLIPTTPQRALDVTADQLLSIGSVALKSESGLTGLTYVSCIRRVYSREIRNASMLQSHGSVTHAMGITTVVHLGVDYHIVRRGTYLHSVTMVWIDADGDTCTGEFSLCGSLDSPGLICTGSQYDAAILAKYIGQIEASFSSVIPAMCA